LITLLAWVVPVALRLPSGREPRAGRVSLALVRLVSLAGREAWPGRVSLARRVLLRRLGVLVVLFPGKILRPLGVLIVAVTLILLASLVPLGCLRLLPPLGNGLGGIGAHAAPPAVRAMMTISPRYIPAIIIPPLRCHRATGDNSESRVAFSAGVARGFGCSVQRPCRTLQYQGVRLPICQNARPT